MNTSSSSSSEGEDILAVRKKIFEISDTTIMKEAKILCSDYSKFDWIRNFSFVIYNGKTLKNCSEFRSFHRNYALTFQAVSDLIEKLEVILREHNIRLGKHFTYMYFVITKLLSYLN